MTTKTQAPIATYVARYVAQQKRVQQRIVKKLLQIAYPETNITFSDTSCKIDPCPEFPTGTTREFYWMEIGNLFPSNVWEKLPRKDRYTALNVLIPKNYQTPVPGGMVYQVRFASNEAKAEWVMLTVGHEIGRCQLVPQTLAARVF